MNTKTMKIALAMIVKGSDGEAELLARGLDNISPFVDGIFITRTQLPGEEKNLAVAAVANEYNAVLSDFEWVYDFSKARNYNFSQVPKDFDYILWTDADDMWRGLEKLKPILKKNPHMDAFGFNYLYDWDEFKKPTVVHRKTMLVKNDGCVVWEGQLHEDLVETRQLEVYAIDGIERLHLSNSDRHEENAKRNVEIAAKQVEDTPNDPRSYWNLANSQFGVSDFEGAKETFIKFLDESESDDEKYLAYARLGDVYKALGDRSNCIRNLQTAIGLKPSYPDAYLQLAHTYYSFGNMDKAEEFFIQGLLKKPQPQRMIVYNPRDYDYNPMMGLARVYFEKNRPDLMLPLLEGCLKIYPDDQHLKNLVKEGQEMKDSLAKALEHVERLDKIEDKEKLRKEMDKLPEDVKSHPSICVIRNKNFVKEESSGRDLVIYCGNTNHEWNPELFKTKGFGGSEEAVIHLAEEWAKIGWRVTVYNNCGHKEYKEYVMTNALWTKGQMMPITYKPFWEWNYRDKQDVTILWRWVKPVDADINTTKLFIDLHDVVPPGEFTEKRLSKIDKVFVKTKFHRSLFPTIPDEKVAVIPNGMETYADPSIEKDPYLVINTSSPDRSMDVLPALWKRVKEQVPEAKMKWCYGFDNFKASYANDPKKIAWVESVEKQMQEAGIENLGRLTQAEVGKLYQQASYLAYPSNFAEIFCISVLKAQAAGCLPVTTSFGAFDEINKFGIKTLTTVDKDTWAAPYQYHFGIQTQEEQKAWVNAMVSALKNHTAMEMSKVQNWAEGFTWQSVANEWNKELCQN